MNKYVKDRNTKFYNLSTYCLWYICIVYENTNSDTNIYNFIYINIFNFYKGRKRMNEKKTK